jgi:oligo-1,6-glucosidase
VLGNFTGDEVRAEVDGWAGAELVLGNYPDAPDGVEQLRPWEARVYRRTLTS